MTRRLTLPLIVLGAMLLGGCAATGQSNRGNGIDQFPMYGGMDRQSVPTLKAADEEFIAGVTKAFGSRENASDAWVEQGFRFYFQDNYSMAMKRFNQAWLLDPRNPDAFWGFASVYHDEGENCKAKDMIDRAVALNLSKPAALADAGGAYTLCALSDTALDDKGKALYFAKSEDFYKRASSESPNDEYIFGSWARAHYWRGEYDQAWEKVAVQRRLGGTPSARLIELLSQKMEEPKAN